jgi:hypothetical protein
LKERGKGGGGKGKGEKKKAEEVRERNAIHDCFSSAQ